MHSPFVNRQWPHSIATAICVFCGGNHKQIFVISALATALLLPFMLGTDVAQMGISNSTLSVQLSRVNTHIKKSLQLGFTKRSHSCSNLNGKHSRRGGNKINKSPPILQTTGYPCYENNKSNLPLANTTDRERQGKSKSRMLSRARYLLNIYKTLCQQSPGNIHGNSTVGYL